MIQEIKTSLKSFLCPNETYKFQEVDIIEAITKVSDKEYLMHNINSEVKLEIENWRVM